MDINNIYIVNLIVVNTVPIRMIDRITDIAFMRYKYMYLKDIYRNIISKNKETFKKPRA